MSVKYTVKQIVDTARPLVNLYQVCLDRWSDQAAAWLRRFGAVVSPEAKVEPPVEVLDPARMQFNRGAQVQGLRVRRAAAFCLVEANTEVVGAEVESDTIFAGKEVWTGQEVSPPRWTLTVDLDGALGMMQDGERLRQMWQRRPGILREAARRLRDLFLEYRLPVTWAVCGHLFLERCEGQHGYAETGELGDWFTLDPASTAAQDPDWYMPDFLRELATEPLFEIAYHSFGHFRYLQAGPETIARDLAFAQHLRERWGLSLTTFVFPYNEIGYLPEVVAAGFRNLRGRIGRWYDTKTLDFPGFRLFLSSRPLHPGTVRALSRELPRLVGKNCNFFTHPQDWVGPSQHLWRKLQSFLEILAKTHFARLGAVKNLSGLCDEGGA